MHENDADIGFIGLGVGRQNQNQSNYGDQNSTKRMHCVLQGLTLGGDSIFFLSPPNLFFILLRGFS
jgi:hypothetical protein